MQTYTFELAGHLDRRWEVAFDGFTFTHATAPGGRPVTLITGPLIDQSALYGMVSRLRDLGVTLISVQPAGLKAPAGADEEPA